MDEPAIVVDDLRARRGGREVLRSVRYPFRPAIDALLAMGDADGDGPLSRAEWMRLQAGYGKPETDAEDISAAVRQYFTSTDAEAPGNSLYGSLVRTVVVPTVRGGRHYRGLMASWWISA